MNTTHCREFALPIGGLTIEVSDAPAGPSLSRLSFGIRARDEASATSGGHVELADRVWSVLDEYFAGGGLDAASIPLAYRASPFTIRVWNRMLQIPFGETVTYGRIAEELGSPGASRAVGNACRTNPIPIFIPCHRVLDSAGRLHGYAGGLERKAALLAAERLLVTA